MSNLFIEIETDRSYSENFDLIPLIPLEEGQDKLIGTISLYTDAIDGLEDIELFLESYPFSIDHETDYMYVSTPESGLYIKQSYLVNSKIQNIFPDDTSYIVDTSRYEKNDIFTGTLLRITSGANVGYSSLVTAYDVNSGIFTLRDPFPNAFEEDTYQIFTETIHFLNNSSELNKTPLLHGGGILLSGDLTSIEIWNKFNDLNSKVRYFNLAFSFEEK